MRYPFVRLEIGSSRLRSEAHHSSAAARASNDRGLVFREQLGGIRHCLELERIARRVEEEHRRLLAGLAFEADRWSNHKVDALALEPGCKCLPLFHLKNDPEMRHGNIVAIDRIGRPRQ